MVNDINRMTRNTTVQMKDLTSNCKDLVSMIAFLQDFEAACDAFHIHKSTKKWLFKRELNGSVKYVIKARDALPTKTARAREGCFTSYAAIANYLWKRYAPTKTSSSSTSNFLRSSKNA